MIERTSSTTYNNAYLWGRDCIYTAHAPYWRLCLCCTVTDLVVELDEGVVAVGESGGVGRQHEAPDVFRWTRKHHNCTDNAM